MRGCLRAGVCLSPERPCGENVTRAAVFEDAQLLFLLFTAVFRSGSPVLKVKRVITAPLASPNRSATVMTGSNPEQPLIG